MPLARQEASTARSRDRANVRAQRRSVAPPYSSRSSGLSGAAVFIVQTLFLTS
jgi:hypothetical protein